MGYIARWGSMAFLVSPSKIVPFNDLSTSFKLKTDNGNSTSGTSATNTRGREPQQMSFSTKYMRALGVDPRERIETWEALVGSSNPLYIGDKRFGPAKMLLTGVDVGELIINDNGDFLSVTLTITLQEDGSKTATSNATSSKTTKSSTSSSKSSSIYAEALAKQNAMNATAPPDDKKNKKLKTLEGRLA